MRSALFAIFKAPFHDALRHLTLRSRHLTPFHAVFTPFHAVLNAISRCFKRHFTLF